MNLSSKMLIVPAVLLAMVIFTACGEEQAPPPEPQEAAAPSMAEENVPEGVVQAKLNLNTATEEEFLTIPDVGERMVGEFFEYRPYVSIRQFREEIGKYVSAEQVAAYEQYVYVPVSPNESDAATLQQLPGVDEAEAAELVAGRPYASEEAFLEALSAYVTATELEAAENYVAGE
jgi:DNA uptake protein ComE-like DNA-binding protein